jgi:hypothetical protein
MIVQRTRGFRRLLALAQAGEVTVLYWAMFAAFSLAIAPGTMAFTGRYVIYWTLVLGGLAVEMLTRGPDKVIAPIYDSSVVRQLPIASRQVAFAVGGLLVFVAFAKDYTISRTFLVCLAVSLYGVLLWSNATLPLWLARRLFARERDQPRRFAGILAEAQAGVRAAHRGRGDHRHSSHPAGEQSRACARNGRAIR